MQGSRGTLLQSEVSGTADKAEGEARSSERCTASYVLWRPARKAKLLHSSRAHNKPLQPYRRVRRASADSARHPRHLPSAGLQSAPAPGCGAGTQPALAHASGAPGILRTRARFCPSLPKSGRRFLNLHVAGGRCHS